MSLAGKESTQGDEYQLRVALNWLIRMLEDDSIDGIQVNTTGIPGQNLSITVDDIVVLYKDGRACFIQAKKNQTDYKAWSLADEPLKEELRKAIKQLEARGDSEVKFYSRSPFGELNSLIEACRKFPDYESFLRDGFQKQKTVLKKLATIVERSEVVAFGLIHNRISFGSPFGFEDWDEHNFKDLDRIVPRADLAMPILERFLSVHEANLRNFKYKINRKDVLMELAKLSLSPTKKLTEAEILTNFQRASSIGRHWVRTIDGERIPRDELSQIIELIEQGSCTILLTDRPGSGKTCLLLDLADELEKLESLHGLLFIKGDQFTEINNEEDLVRRGLPEDIVSQCARLSSFRHVVVIIDSLDFLSLSRQHSALKVFLGLIDRLEKIDNVTIVAACRNFDLQYDPLLRGRTWQHSIHLQLLDFETIVKPFLADRWKIDPDSLNFELRELIRVPQNLRIYEKLAKLRKELNPKSAYELYESFLEEIVTQNSLLGNQAMDALQSMADDLMQNRSKTCSKIVFNAAEGVVRHLISQEILVEDPIVGDLSFSHQTLADCLIVRSILAKKKTLLEFILDHPQLPFIRPIVRTFLFFLRAHQPNIFRKQVWQVLSHGKIAYHIKRLICESLAEISPVGEDWRLLNRIFTTQPDLFSRFMLCTQEVSWFNFLKQNWLFEAQASEETGDLLYQFYYRLRIWMNQCPTEVIALWRQGIVSQYIDPRIFVRIVSSSLGEFKAWDAKGVRELLETLVEHVGNERSSLGKALSQWVNTTNSGDDLLWSYTLSGNRLYSFEGLKTKG